MTWSDAQHEAFVTLKSKLVDNCVRSYFDKSAETCLVCDASPFGLSAVLVQVHSINGTKETCIIAYASMSLTETEKNYGHIEKEALAIHFGCLKFRLYFKP